MGSRYEGQCGTCAYFKDYRDCSSSYDTSMPDYEKGYCEYYRSYYYPSEDGCNHYSDRRCYVTTEICNLLGYDNECHILKVSREFRNEVLKKDKKYKKLLNDYDIVGPIIAKNLKEEFSNDEDKEMVIDLFNFFVLPTVSLIEEKRYDEAIKRYAGMIIGLEEYYCINKISLGPDQIDYTNGIIKSKKC